MQSNIDHETAAVGGANVLADIKNTGGGKTVRPQLYWVVLGGVNVLGCSDKSGSVLSCSRAAVLGPE
jgi:hypothetical protein